MDFWDYLLRIGVSLIVVIVLILVALPFIIRRFGGIDKLSGKGNFEIKKVSPIAKGIYIVELEIKGKTVVLCVSDKGADVIYREDDNAVAPGSGSNGDSTNDTTR